MLLVFNDHHPQPRKIQKVADLIRQGNLICYPTDTGYGIGCDPFQRKTVEKLFRLSGRPKNKPASLLVANFKQMAQYGYINDRAYRVAKRVIPGPYTLILKATKQVPRPLHGKRREVGVRVPDHPVILALLEELEEPLLNVTASNFDREYLDDPHEIDDIWGKQLGAVIDSGIIQENPSTVIDFSSGEPEVLRVGQGDPDVFL